MTTLKTSIFAVLLAFTSIVSANEPKGFALSVGSGFGSVGLSRVNGGAFTNKVLFPEMDFKATPIYFSVGATVGHFKHTDWDIELEHVTYKSDVGNITGQRRTEATVNFLNFNLGVKVFPLTYFKTEQSYFGITPYVKLGLTNAIYNYSDRVDPQVGNTNVNIIESTSVGYAPLLDLYVGGNYMLNNHFGAYAQLGYGFEALQFGVFYKL